MAYVTNSEIELRLGTQTYVQLTDDAGSGSANSSVVDEARKGAEGEVNSYLARRYATPIDLGVHTDLSGVIKSITLDIVEHRLRCRRPPVPDDSIAQHERALGWLKDVAEGVVTLVSAAGELRRSTAFPIAKSVGETRILSHDELADY